MGLRVAFRVDAGALLGVGHLLRCLTLANVLRDRGAECVFISATDQADQSQNSAACRRGTKGCGDDLKRAEEGRFHKAQTPGSVEQIVGCEGFEFRAVAKRERAAQSLGQVNVLAPSPLRTPSPSPASLPSLIGAEIQAGSEEALSSGSAAFEWRFDVEQTLAILHPRPVDWLVVDHYGVDSRWERLARSACRKLLVIDDLADRNHDCDLLVDQSLGRSIQHYRGLLPVGTPMLLGTRHAMLRPEFRRWRTQSLAWRKRAPSNRLLVSFGGGDQALLSVQVLEALCDCPLPDGFSITVVSGLMAGSTEELLAAANRMPFRTHILADVRNMAELMAESDLAIGGAGSTAWERCALGLPAVVMVLAENQRFVARALEARSAAIAASSVQQLVSEVASLCAGPLGSSGKTRLQAMSLAASKLVDGLGTARVCGKMMALNV
jgi:UDP-2,4-diacetamido-2,4,6-trideoxy-beta-L-altropyranose hydrolase